MPEFSPAKVDSKPIENAPVGPLAYRSKYQGFHQPNSVTNYGLAVHRQISPTQAAAEAAVRGSSLRDNDSKLQKIPPQQLAAAL